jgi:hypothetical protein
VVTQQPHKLAVLNKLKLKLAQESLQDHLAVPPETLDVSATMDIYGHQCPDPPDLQALDHHPHPPENLSSFIARPDTALTPYAY